MPFGGGHFCPGPRQNKDFLLEYSVVLQYTPTLHSDPGQTEYEYPTGESQEARQKKGLGEPLLSYSEPQVEDQGYLYININNRSPLRERQSRERED